jgi:hypothetical protein
MLQRNRWRETVRTARRAVADGGVSMFFDDGRPHSSDGDIPESGIRFAMMFGELWHDWLEAMSEVAYQTHRACEFFAQNGAPSKGQYGDFVSRSIFALRTAKRSGRTGRSTWISSGSACDRWIRCKRPG